MKTITINHVLFSILLLAFTSLHAHADSQIKTGKYTYQNGSVYFGELRNSVPEGKGTLYYASGNTYRGQWKNNAPHGEGVMQWTSGKVVRAIWNHGRIVRELELETAETRKKASPVGVKPEPRTLAVIIGVSYYSRMSSLYYADDDAYRIYNYLKSQAGGAVPDKDIQVLFNEKATYENIMYALRKVFVEANENDKIMVYFSGHGLPGAFLPTDYNGYSNQVDHQDIIDLLNNSKAKQKIIMADACHSGSLLNQKNAPNSSWGNYYASNGHNYGGTALFLSSRCAESSLESSHLRSGVFSHFLIHGLKGSADSNGNQIVTMSELYHYVHHQVRNYTRNLQTPQITGDYSQSMPVATLGR